MDFEGTAKGKALLLKMIVWRQPGPETEFGRTFAMGMKASSGPYGQYDGKQEVEATLAAAGQCLVRTTWTLSGVRVHYPNLWWGRMSLMEDNAV